MLYEPAMDKILFPSWAPKGNPGVLMQNRTGLVRGRGGRGLAVVALVGF